jgi:hypothetical protein
VKVVAVVPREAGAQALVGRVLCHNARDASGRLQAKKGVVLDPEAAARLVAAVSSTVHLLEIQAGELHEETAGSRLARSAAGPGVAMRPAAGGQWALAAAGRGLLSVDVRRLDSVNALEGVGVFTLYDGQVVEAGEVVARAKVTPLVIAESVVDEAERRCGAGESRGVVSVRGFRPLPVGVVTPAGLGLEAGARFQKALGEKLSWFGAPLARLEAVAPEPAAAARALEACLESGAVVLVVAGANLLDPLDPFFLGLERLGGRLLRRGAPADPGSLLWLARLGETPVLGVTSCGMFSQGTLFDLVLPRVLAGEALDGSSLGGYGHGGLLTREMRFRFPPYRRGGERGSVE